MAAATAATAAGHELLAAIWRKDGTEARALIAAGADLTVLHAAHGSTALILAAGLGLADVCAQLIAAGADVNAVNREGRTALLVACGAEQVQAALALTSAKGINLNARGADGASALDLSLRKGGSMGGNPMGGVAQELRRLGAAETPGGGCALQ